MQFLASFSSASDIRKAPGGFAKFVLGENPLDQLVVKPYGVTVRNGRIYVCDTVNNSVDIFDLRERSFRYFQPSGRAQLTDPVNLDVTADGEMYIADTRRGQVLIYNAQQDWQASIGDKDSLKPTDVMVSSGKIYVCDLKSRSVRIYDAGTREFIESIPAADGAKEAHLFSPTNIDLDKDGNIFVSDTGAFNVKEFSPKGDLLKVIGGLGDAPGSFARPKGVAVDHEGRVYVVDAAFNNVQVFDPQGKLLLFFPEVKEEIGFTLPAGIFIDYDHIEFFRDFIAKDFEVEYLVFVTSQYGERKINVFGFGHKK